MFYSAMLLSILIHKKVNSLKGHHSLVVCKIHVAQLQKRSSKLNLVEGKN